MSEKRRFTAEEWAAIRRRWEESPAEGYEWLAREITAAWGLDVTRPAIRQMAMKHGWSKGEPLDVPLEVRLNSGKVSQPSGAKVSERSRKVSQQESTPKPRKHPKGARTGEGYSLPAAEPHKAHTVDLKPGQKPVGYLGTGAPSKFRPEYAQMLIEYFDIEAFTNVVEPGRDGEDAKVVPVPTTFPTLQRFAWKIGVTSQVLTDWAAATNEDGSARYPDFRLAHARARDVQAAITIEGSMAGAYDSRAAALALKNLAQWRDKTDIEVSTAPVSAHALETEFGTRMLASHARMKAVLAERAALLGADIDADD